MISETTLTHRLFACCIFAGVDPQTFSTDWLPTAKDKSIQRDIEDLLLSTLNEWKDATLTNR